MPEGKRRAGPGCATKAREHHDDMADRFQRSHVSHPRMLDEKALVTHGFASPEFAGTLRLKEFCSPGNPPPHFEHGRGPHGPRFHPRPANHNIFRNLHSSTRVGASPEMTFGSGQRENFFSLEENEFRHRGSERAEKAASRNRPATQAVLWPHLQLEEWRPLSRRKGEGSSSGLCQKILPPWRMDSRFCDSLERQVRKA